MIIEYQELDSAVRRFNNRGYTRLSLTYDTLILKHVVGTQNMIDITQIEEELVKLSKIAQRKANNMASQDQIFRKSVEYLNNQRRFTELKSMGRINDEKWYIIKDGEIFLEHQEKEHALSIMRKSIKESRDWYFQHGSGPVQVILFNHLPKELPLTENCMEF